MKRTGNLKQEWCNYDTLMEAWREVSKGKTFHNSFLRYESRLATNLENLLMQLENETYEPRPPREFYVHVPKLRLIQAPYLEDRIVQHALMFSVRNLIENRLIYHTYACRKGKGTHNASYKLQQWVRHFQESGYYLKLDIQKYFYSIDHDILTRQIEEIIKCKSSVKLLEKFYRDETGKGLPLGNVTSQVLANLALNPVDHFIKRELKHKHYIRYMDDLLILDWDRDRLEDSKEKIKNEVQKLNLDVNSKTHISRVKDGIDFVGYKTWHNRRIIRKRTLHNVKRKLKNDPNLQMVSSFLSHSKNTNSIVYVAKKIIETAPEQIEFIITWILNNEGEKYNEIFQT